jgi:hypothetical protein
VNTLLFQSTFKFDNLGGEKIIIKCYEEVYFGSVVYMDGVDLKS